jgi:hypothetical protein
MKKEKAHKILESVHGQSLRRGQVLWEIKEAELHAPIKIFNVSILFVLFCYLFLLAAMGFELSPCTLPLEPHPQP